MRRPLIIDRRIGYIAVRSTRLAEPAIPALGESQRPSFERPSFLHPVRRSTTGDRASCE